MNNDNNIQDELSRMDSDLPSNPLSNPLSVPEGYFEGLAASVMSRIKGSEAATTAGELESLSPFLASLSRTMPYSVPENYFTQTVSDLTALTADDASVVLDGLDRTMPFAIPQGYFQSLPDLVLRRVKPEGAKVIRMTGRKWMRIAAAAVVTGFIMISGYLYMNNKPADTAPPAAVAQQLKNISTSELDEFLDLAQFKPANTGTATISRSRADVKKLVSDVSDKELESFLNQVPTDDGDVLIN
jgi:hypothetical protein